MSNEKQIVRMTAETLHKNAGMIKRCAYLDTGAGNEWHMRIEHYSCAGELLYTEEDVAWPTNWPKNITTEFVKEQGWIVE